MSMQSSFPKLHIYKNCFLKIFPLNYDFFRNFSFKLLEVGHLETPIVSGNYKTGQIFLHKQLAYRGVILFPWIARVYDRDLVKQMEQFMDSDGSSKLKSSQAESSQTFYNVLIDTRDFPFIRSQSEIVTFFDNEESGQGLVTIPGLDYVAHKDILPYKPTEQHPLHHEMLSKFFTYNSENNSPFVAKTSLRVWEKKIHSWLELTKVQQETTEQVKVTVIPFYMGRCRSQYWWRYNIFLENLSSLSVYLRSRHWRIFTNSGILESVRGKGVMGQEVILSRREPVYQYCSHISLDEPSGHMWGSFKMQREDGSVFDCNVPKFSLDSTGGAMTPPDHIGE